MVWPTHLPQLAREIAEHTSAALAAARSRSAAAWEDATTELVALPYEQVAGVHATMMRELLEELHPDGLTGEDVQAVFERSARTGAAWLPSLHPDTVVAVLTGTLGVSDPDAPKARPEGRPDRAGRPAGGSPGGPRHVPASRARGDRTRRDRRDALTVGLH